MALPTGVYLRGAVYQLRIKVPKDLLSLYGKDIRYRASLNTSDRREATAQALGLWAQFAAEFQQRRREMSPQKVLVVTADIRKQLAEAVYAAEVARDEALRKDKAKTARMTSRTVVGEGVFPEIAETSRLAPLSEEITSRRADLNRQSAALVAAALASGNLQAFLPIAQLQAKRLGLGINWDSEDGAAALEECLRAYSRAKDVAIARDAGRVVETPELPQARPDAQEAPASISAAKAPRSLDDVLPEWARYRRAKPNAVARTKYALRLLAESGQLAPLKEITRRHGREFHAWLSEDVQGLTDKTAKNHVDCIRSLLQVAAVELEWIERNPWQGMELPLDDSVERPPWSAEELQRLLEAPLFQSYALPSVARAGGPAAYWMPLLGLYSGARVGELGQLEVADILSDRDGHWLSIHKRAEGSTLKTTNSERVVAIHPELVRLGFLDYVQDLKDAKEVKLFPVIPRTASRSRGDNFSQWFGQFRREAGITERYPDFHSFRHNVRGTMRDAGIDARLADAVTGHTDGKGGTGDAVYGRSVAPAAKRSAVEAIRYPNVELPHVYRGPL